MGRQKDVQDHSSYILFKHRGAPDRADPKQIVRALSIRNDKFMSIG